MSNTDRILPALFLLSVAAFCFSQDVGAPTGAARRELGEPYENPLHQKVRFGRRSYYLTPWRSYMDTWPASRFLECLGIVCNGIKPAEADALAQVFSEAGIRAARVEIGWGSFNYDNPGELHPNAEKKVRPLLTALGKHGVRPLILLNANSGWPCPIKSNRPKLLQNAPKGAGEVIINSSKGIKPFYSGLKGQAYQIAFPRIVKIEKLAEKRYKCTLSAPLNRELRAGSIWVMTQRYQPFAGAVFADGTPNPAAKETLEGWMLYVKGICDLAKSCLGTEGKDDAGFDLEVWNEYTFGSQFLQDRNYYEPDRKFKEPITYENHGIARKGHEIILPMTIDWTRDPRNNCPGVKVISGFANQRPWESGSGMWPGQAGFSRHYYTGTNQRVISADTLKGRNAKSGPLNALGKPDGTPDKKDWHTVIPGTYFVPRHTISLPEYWHYAYQTEFMTRDIQPFPGPWSHHHRYSHPGTGRPAEVWKTETNYYRAPFGGRLRQDHKADRDSAAYKNIMMFIAAKGLLRMYTMDSHKGIQTITVYNAKGKIDHFRTLGPELNDKLKEAGYQLTPQVRAAIGLPLQMLKRVVDRLKTGEPITEARPLEVSKLVELKPRLVHKGDGTPAHPDRTHVDDFAVLPFQMAADKFMIAYYVVTRNAVHEWDKTKGPLDPARYTMPTQQFEVTLHNVRGTDAVVSAWDPMTDKEVPVATVAAADNSLTVRVDSLDYPRFLTIQERQPGPLLSNVTLKAVDNGTELSFTGNVDGTVRITHGPHPKRLPVSLIGVYKNGALLGEYFSGTRLEQLVCRRMDAAIDFKFGGDGPVPGIGRNNYSVRWTGTVTAPATEEYTFFTRADDGCRLWVDDKLLIDDWGRHRVTEKSGKIKLEAGKRVPIKVEYKQGGGRAAMHLLWQSATTKKAVIPGQHLSPPDPKPARLNTSQPAPVTVQAKKPAIVKLPALAANEGVQLVYEANGLTARWPRWPYDVKGVLHFSKPEPFQDSERRGINLPDLAAGNKPADYELAAAFGWKGDKTNAAHDSPDGTFLARIQYIEGDLTAARAALPDAAPTDTVEIKATTWNGRPAWQIDYQMDPVMHPGLKKVRQQVLLAPCAKGYALLHLQATPDAFKAKTERLNAVKASIGFE